MRVFSVLDQTKRKKRFIRPGQKASPNVERVEFSPDATLLAVCCAAGHIGPWDVQRGERAFPGQEPEFRPGTRSTFYPSGRWLIGTSTGGGLAVYDLESKRTSQEQGATATVIPYASLTPDGSFLICSRYTPPPAELRELTGRAWDPGAASTPLWSTPVLPDSTPQYTWNRGLATLADGERFVTAEYAMWKGGQITLRSVRTGEILQTRWIGLNDEPELVIAPGDSYFVAQVKRDLHVWTSFDPDERRRTLTNDGRKHFTGVAFHPSGKYLAATSNDKTVKVYDVAAWEVAKVFEWKIGRMRSIAFSRDGMLAAAGGDKGLVVVWDVDL